MVRLLPAPESLVYCFTATEEGRSTDWRPAGLGAVRERFKADFGTELTLSPFLAHIEGKRFCARTPPKGNWIHSDHI